MIIITHKTHTIRILLIICLIVFSIVVTQLIQNTTSNQHLGTQSSPTPEKVMLKVVCNEQNGYCKLVKSLPDEQLDDFKMVSSATPINEGFDYKTFAKRSFIRISKNEPIRSFIKIADNPPPIFSS